jgi:hypothetical protein
MSPRPPWPFPEKDSPLLDFEKTINHLKRYNLLYFQHKAYDLRLRRRIASIIGCRRLELKYPGLREKYRLSREDYRRRIEPFYREYIDTVSSEIMASSLELSVFLLFLCDMAQPKKILDLGSGFSSFLFRSHALSAREEPVVWSVDDSGEWLDRTAAFLSSHGLPAANLMTWDAFSENRGERFDFIFYDLGPFPFRMDCLRPMLEKRTDAHGIIVLDDMHSAEYGLFVKRALQGTRFQPFDAGCYTRDHFSRFSLLVTY